MSLFEVGRLAVKIAGRDAGKKCIVVDLVDENTVLIDGQTRRRKCNIKHLEPLNQVLKIKKDASSAEVKSEFKKLGLEVLETKPKEKKERPRKQRKEKLKAKKEDKKKVVEPKKKPVETKEEKASDFEKTVEKESKADKSQQSSSKAETKEEN